tara:strand:- start:10723 stop:10908 length:186 start_codon:yes stop_codon:yes gene_type:complete
MKNKKNKESLKNSLSNKIKRKSFLCKQKNYNDEIIDDMTFEESFLLELYKRNMDIKKSGSQ